ncbi:MAG: hypothetical protein CVU38_17435 [Chloroflexi bacterium HGW-Chloroflexi-1]|nr:MAG: hypothetical protein CVU38_17435 [Chloroflexi bacterium HGW-Chloroflexi-1]
MPDMVQSPGSTRQLVFAVVVCLAVPLGVGVWLDNTVTTFPAAVLGGMAVTRWAGPQHRALAQQ